MKTFFNLIQEVLEPRLCHRCGGCVAFCTAINFGALEMGEDGRPSYKDKDKCIECGLCYDICPEIDELREETKRRISWSAPMGRVLEVMVARARDQAQRAHARDGGVVTNLLLHLLDLGRIDGALVTKIVDPLTCRPWLARTRQEIIAAGGFHFDASPGLSLFGSKYSAYPPYMDLISPMAKQDLRRIAFVGRPCQIETMRRMETLGIVPSEVIKYYIGLFCMGNFRFSETEQAALEKLGDFKWADIKKVNFKDGLQVHLKTNEIKVIEFAKLDFMKRVACQYCGDYSAEFADIACGGMGATEGWTTVLVRTPLGRAIVAEAADAGMELFSNKMNQEVAMRTLSKVRVMSDRKKNLARQNRKSLSEKTKKQA